ncbi:MAG TPA: tetratricopeptide repeat protein [Dongiaceae bacterium]|nr:tetratricopeptide repeat protein [Dongiaceae bacterium]
MGLSAPARSDYQTGVDAYSKGNFKQALEEWKPLAEGGDATAQNSVGALYDHGLGVDEDDATAAYWYQLAADQNLPLAMRNLANMYAGGHGVPFDQALAESWYEKAAKMGDPGAIKRMATLQPAGEFAAAAEPATIAEATPAEPAPTPAAEPMTVAGDDQASEAAPVAPAPAPEAQPAAEPAPAENTATAESPAAAPGDPNQPLQYGDTGSPAPAPAATPAATQQAAVTPAPSDPGNWLIGMWQGPSLGCPPNGGLEFAPDQTLSYYGGQIAARLKAKYEVAGDRVTVTSIGVDGVGSKYEYERRGPDTFVIAAVPADMPSSLIGVEHHRCGATPKVAAAPQAAPAPALAPAPQTAAPTPKSFVPEEPVAAAQPAPKPVPVKPVAEAPKPAPIQGGQQATVPQPSAASPLDAGWEAFGRGDYAGALAIWQPLAEQGDVNMQLLIGSIYDLGQGVPQDDAEAVKWYERAATQGSAKGQYQLGALYARSAQVKDPFQGYKWLTIAARTLESGSQGGVTADQATTLRTLIQSELSKDQIAKAKAEADAFKPSKG